MEIIDYEWAEAVDAYGNVYDVEYVEVEYVDDYGNVYDAWEADVTVS